MTTDQVYVGLVLTVGLAVACQLVGARLRIPALILLLPVGVAAGALTSDVNPNNLFGAAFQPMVALAVAVILYDSGLGLDWSKLTGHTRQVVVRLLVLGVPITLVATAFVSEPLFGMAHGAAVMLGAILVVSGPTVVGPLLGVVRPTERLRHILAWEGSLIDPIGGLLGAVVFHAVAASTRPSHVDQVWQFVLSIGVGVIGGTAGFAVLWFLLRKLRLGESAGAAAQLAVVVVVAGLCDAAREDTGLIAAIGMGLALANVPGFTMPARQPFFEVLVQLTIGVLFISISATVTPASMKPLLIPTLALVALLVLVIRPAVAALSTLRTDLPTRQRAFVGWMAPRGIVAAATASTFAVSLVDKGIQGATKILPGTFLVIVMTVTIYGLTAAPVARLLHVVRQRVTRPLLVGGQRWTIDLATMLKSTGMDVVMWAGRADQRDEISRVGIELAPADLLTEATGSRAAIEGVTDVLLLTDEHAFNVIIAALLEGGDEGRVYRIGSPEDTREGSIAAISDEILFPTLTDESITAEYSAGARFALDTSGRSPDDGHLLFRIRSDGTLSAVTGAAIPDAVPGDASIRLERSA